MDEEGVYYIVEQTPVVSGEDLVDAQQALVDSKAKLVATSTYAAGVYGSLADALSQSIALDTKGLNP